jgi:hypothetical protein
MGGTMTKGITDAQIAALDVLAPIVEPSTYLAGGVAVALHFGHRLSHDLDLFSPIVEPDRLAEALARCGAAASVVSKAPGTLHLQVAGVPASILRYGYRLLRPPEKIASIRIPVANHEDLVCMKLSAITSRGAKRDFWDLHVLLASTGTALPTAIDLYQKKYDTEDIGHVIRSLAYFGDADGEPSPAGLTQTTWEIGRAHV